jgi:hypothetical protein
MRHHLAISRFQPGWEERKHRQTVAGACVLLFGEDLSDQLYPRIWHRARRTGNPGRGPQPPYEATAKVLRDEARKRGVDPDVMLRLEAQAKAQRRAGTRLGPPGWPA